MTQKRRINSRDLFSFTMVDDPQVSPDGTCVAWVKTWMDPETNRYRSNVHVCLLYTSDAADE